MNFFKTKYILVLVLLCGGLFYWFEIKQVLLKKECNKAADHLARILLEDTRSTFSTYADYYEFYYKQCIRAGDTSLLTQKIQKATQSLESRKEIGELMQKVLNKEQ